MPFYQYTGPEHTLIRTKAGRPEKSKVVQGEIIEIEKDLFEAGRLLIAGFVQIAEEDVEEFKDLLANPRPAPVETTSSLMAEPTLEEPAVIEEKTAETTEEVPTEPLHTEVESSSLLNGAQPGEAPAVEVTTEVIDDGEKEITLEVTTEEPKTDGSEGTDIGKESDPAAPTATTATTVSTETPKKEEKIETPKKELPKKK